MGDVKSKNMYELLGNDHEQDSDREPEPPTKAIDRSAARSGKRAGPEAAPARATHSERGRGGRRGGASGNEAAYQSGAGNSSNRRQGVPDDVRDDRHPRRTREHGTETRRGGRGGRGGRGYDDRHSRGLPDHPKQGDLAWGANTGESELKDEQAGEAIANQEAKEGFDANVPAPVDADGNPLKENDDAEAEEKQKSYAEYLVEQAEKKLSLGGSLAARKANEGSKQDKKWASAKAISREGEEENYIAGSGGKAKREREQKTKNVLDIDHSWSEPQRTERGGRGGRGGRGEFRGEGRGEGRGRGGGRGRGRGGESSRGVEGGRGRGGESGPRGGRGGRQEVNPNDQSAFPSLGA